MLDSIKGFEPKNIPNFKDVDLERKKLSEQLDKIKEDISKVGGEIDHFRGGRNPLAEPLILKKNDIIRKLNQLEVFGKKANPEERGD